MLQNNSITQLTLGLALQPNGVGTYESRRLQLLTTLLQTVVIRVRSLVGIRHESLVSVSAELTFFAVQPKASCLSNFATFRHSCCRSNVG